jgi:hypothetical protein
MVHAPPQSKSMTQSEPVAVGAAGMVAKALRRKVIVRGVMKYILRL